MKRVKRFPATSIQQNRLFHYIREQYPNAQLNWPIPVRFKRYYRYADVALIEFHIDFEYDGKGFHNRLKDDFRDQELKDAGWVTIRVNKNNFWSVVGNLPEIIKKYGKKSPMPVALSSS